MTTPPLVSFPLLAASSIQWNTSSTTLRMNGEPAVLRGVVVSCLEFACDGQGRPSNCAQILHDRDVEAISKLLLETAAPATAPPVEGGQRGAGLDGAAGVCERGVARGRLERRGVLPPFE